MNEILTTLTTALAGAPALALVAAIELGVASVLLSPCHLASVPLIVAVVRARNHEIQRAAPVALRFGVGLLFSFAIVGGVTIALGRIAGDLGTLGTLLAGGILLAFGLEILEVIHLPWFPSTTSRASGRTARPILVGFLFGASLGPCTFSLMAPALGVAFAFADTRPILAASLVAAFAAAHTGVVVIAGVFGDATARFLDSSGASRAVVLLRRGLGVMLIAAGLALIATGG